MEDLQNKMITLHESLCSLSLQLHLKVSHLAEQILLGKLLTTKSFKRFTITKVISKNWKAKSRVQIEKIDNTIFKFLFCSTEDKYYIYEKSPWSINEAHWILKLWPV